MKEKAGRPEIKEREKFYPKILEIGVGEMFSACLRQVNVDEYKQAYIVRVDISRNGEGRQLNGVAGGLNKARWRDKLFGSKKFEGKIDYAQCDAAGALPFKDGQFDSVFITNVFSEPFFAYESESRATVELVLREAARVMTDDGEIIITETYSPWVGPSFDKLTAIGARLGLEVKACERPTIEEEEMLRTKEYEMREEKAGREFKEKFPYLVRAVGMAGTVTEVVDAFTLVFAKEKPAG